MNRSLWISEGRVFALDQTLLPHERVVLPLDDANAVAEAIRAMRVRGAPLIGIAGAFGLALALREDPSALDGAHAALLSTRPTAVNLPWALDRVRAAVAPLPAADRFARAWAEASRILDEEVAACAAIGEQGLGVLRALKPRSDTLNVLTHCNAGWLATGAWGTALAPVYKAQEAGLPVHVWVDETRPRSQGASLTAWELGEAGVPHTLVTDTMAGHLMRTGRVDVCLVGSDRTTARGDVCNKIGTYLVALAAHDNGVPFYACVPTSSIDFALEDGMSIPIEERSPDEVTHVRGQLVAPANTRAANFAFDVTPARLVTGLVTERGICPASRHGLLSLYREQGAAP